MEVLRECCYCGSKEHFGSQCLDHIRIWEPISKYAILWAAKKKEMAASEQPALNEYYEGIEAQQQRGQKALIKAIKAGATEAEIQALIEKHVLESIK